MAKGPACPKTGVLADASRIYQFAGSSGNLSELIYHANMVNVAETCDYGDDHVDLKLALQVQGFRDVAGGPAIYPTRYFVAVVDAKDQILAKKSYDLDIAFEGKRKETVARDKIDRIRIPVKSKEAGATYQILLGFQLTPDQVIYNRVTSRKNQGGT